MNTDQHQRPASDRLRAATHESINFQPKPRGWTPPNEHTEPDPERPLDHLDATQRNVLINGLLEDWDNPIFTELGLCRAHAITLDQLRAVAERPDFQRYLGIIREIRAARRAEIESAAATAAIARLIYITQCDIGSASAMKECRLAIKQILAIINHPPTPESEPATEPPTQEAPNASEGMVPEVPANTTKPTTPAQPASERGGSGETPSASATNPAPLPNPPQGHPPGDEHGSPQKTGRTALNEPRLERSGPAPATPPTRAASDSTATTLRRISGPRHGSERAS